MRTVLISGGAGFIGSHLVDYFLKQGDFVAVVDNLYTGRPENLRNHIDLNSNISIKQFAFLRKDISVCTPVDFKQFKFDLVLHFASPASPIHYTEQPFMTMNANSKGTEVMLEIASRDKATFLLASTSEVYGDPKVHPQPESYWGNVNSFGARSCYDESKRFAEALTYLYCTRKALNVRVVRTFNVYGPRMQMDDGRAVPTFINQALRNEPITVFGDGSQTRSLCYIDDYVEGIVRLLNAPINYPVNIGNPEELTMNALAGLIYGLCDSKSEFVYKGLPPDDPIKRCPNIEKAINILGWKPKTDLVTGLKKTIEYFKKEMNV